MAFLTALHKVPKSLEIMVIGGGRLTHYLTELLFRHSNRTNIKIIEKDRQLCNDLSEVLYSVNRRCLIIHGDGTNEDLLMAEDIDKMDAFICLGESDEENAIISLYAQQMGVDRVITKVNHSHQNMIRNLGLGLDSMITPQTITAHIVSNFVNGLVGAIGSVFRTTHPIYERDEIAISAVEFVLSKRARCQNIALKDLNIKRGVLVGCIARDSEIIIPSGDSRLQIGDSVILITKNMEIRDIDDIINTEEDDRW